MEIVNVFAQFGVPTFILGFVLWFLLRPLVMVLVKNIEAQTEVLGKITHSLSDLDAKLESQNNSLQEIKNKLK
ncbi:MAG: hypothetical protein V9E90_01490 [Saprospiraceae bacterium]